MKNFITTAAAAAMLAALPAHAQTTATSRNNSRSNAVAAVDTVGAIFMPGALGGTGAGGVAGAAAASATSNGGWNQPQLIMSTAGAPSTGTFNDCGVAWSLGMWIVTASATNESPQCVAQREAIFAASVLGDKALAFERMCSNDAFRKATTRREGQQCAQTIEEQKAAEAKAARGRPAAAQPARVSQLTRAQCISAANAHVDQAAYRAAVAQCPAN